MQEVNVLNDKIINENNVLLLSPTGSGKQGVLLPLFRAFAAEILSVQCLILVPSA